MDSISHGANESSRFSVSRCGLYIAVVSGAQLQVHSLNSKSAQNTREGPFPLVFQLNQIVSSHRREHGYPLSHMPVSVLQIEWEHIKSRPSSKLAISVSNDLLTLAIVLDFVGSDPVIIEADSIGIERIQWVPSPEPDAGSYANSTILAVFSKLGLSVKIYSLLNTHVLFTIAKPLGTHIIQHPKNDRIWSIVASPYYPKNSPARSIGTGQTSSGPVLLHFVTDGESCSLLASLRLRITPSEAAQFSWSDSGRWLQYFDTENCLSGYNLAIFNLLAIHNTPVDDITSHEASPTISYAPRSGPADNTDATGHVSVWGSLEGADYILTLPSRLNTTITVQTYDINHLLRLKPQKLALSSSQMWLHTSDPNHKVRYRAGVQIPNIRNMKWVKTLSFSAAQLINYDRCVVVIKNELDTLIKAHIAFTIFGTSRFLDAHPLPENGFLLAFADHVAHRTSQGISVIATSRYTFSEVTFTAMEDAIVVTMVEESPSGPIWRQVEHSTSTTLKKAAPGSNDGAVESTTTLMSRIRSGIESTEEPTDTFQGLGKRRKANPV